jgi:hypothetical protein
MKKIILAVCCVVLSSCATRSVMDGIMSSWEGTNIDSVVAQWGYPDEQREFNGKKLYVWHHNKGFYMPATTNTTGTVSSTGQFNARSTTTGGHAISGGCDRILEVDRSGTVTSWQWRGNNCPFMEAMEYKTWRNRSIPKASPSPSCRPPLRCDQ